MKKRVSIYIDGDVWARIKECAWEERMSASAFIEAKLMFARDEAVGKDEQVDSANRDEPSEKTIREKKIELSKGKDLRPKISPSDEQMLREKMEVIAKKKPESLTGWVGGYSKGRQLGKRGAK